MTKDEKEEIVQLYKQSDMFTQAFAEEFDLNSVHSNVDFARRLQSIFWPMTSASLSK